MGEQANLKTTIAASDPISERPDDEQMLLIVMTGNSVGEMFPLNRSKALTVIGRDDAVDIKVMDAEISRQHAAIRFDVRGNCFVLADLNSRNGTQLNGEYRAGEAPLQIGDKIRLGNTTVLRVSSATETEAQYARQMYQAALRDGLTGSYNRRYLDDRLSAELAFAKRHQSPLTILLADLDHFKQTNDTYGHQAGDKVLTRFAALLESKVRAEDVVARYGGEEFMVLCRDTSEQQATVLAERLRMAVQTDHFVHHGHQIPVTVSIGIAGTIERGTYELRALVEHADKALYQAKGAGRNCWKVAAG